MVPFILLLPFFADTKPMKVVIADPVIELEIQSLDGTYYSLDQVAENSFCFFLSLDCSYCLEAISQARIHFSQRHCIFLFLSEKKAVEEFLKSNSGLSHDDAYLIIDPDQLKPYAIETIPALLAYKDSKLRAAVHGSFKDRICALINQAYDKGVEKGERP